MSPASKRIRATIYCRISRDRVGESTGVGRQEAECRELCERSGWDVVEVLTDNDVSAYSGKRRPGYERLLELLRAGGADVVVAWNTDRLHRRLSELVTYTEIVAPKSITTHTVRTGPIDLSTPSGILVAQQLGAVAEYESRNRSARVRSAKDQRASWGTPANGNRTFGYEAGAMKLIPREAEMIRKATRGVIRGVSLSAIAREWRATDTKTVTGKEWTANAVRLVLLRARNAGLRVHRGVIAGPAKWEGCVTPEEWHACRRILEDPARRTSPGTAPKYLGALRYRCGAELPDGSECGFPMKVTRSGPVKFRFQVYICTRRPKLDVQHVTIQREALDEYVTEQLVGAMVEYGVGPAIDDPETDDPIDDVTEIEASQAALAAELGAGRLSAVAYSAANAQLAERLERAEAQRAGAVIRSAGDERLSGFEADPRGVWDSLPLDIKREFMERYVTVTVLRASSQSRWYGSIADRVRLKWYFQPEG